MPYTRFTLWDFLVGVVPGIVVILITISLLPEGYIREVKISPISGNFVGPIIVLVIGYLLGSIVQATSRKLDDILHSGLVYDSKLDRWIYKNLPENSKIHHWRHEGFLKFEEPFIETMKLARKDREENNRTVRRRFLEGAQVFFDDEESETYTEMKNKFDDYKLRELTYSYLVKNNIGQTQRFHTLYVLMRGLYFVIGAGAILHIAVLFMNIIGMHNSIWTPPILGVIIFFLILGTVISYIQRRKFHRSMAKSMINDFYTSELIG